MTSALGFRWLLAGVALLGGIGVGASALGAPFHRGSAAAVLPDRAPPTATVEPLGARTVYLLDLNTHRRDFEQAVSYVRAFDPTTGREVRIVPVRSVPNLAVSPDGRYLYVLDSYRMKVVRGEHVDALTVFDLQQHRTAAEITLPAGARTGYNGVPSVTELLPSADGKRLYVLLMSIARGHRILTVDTQTYQVVGDFAVPMACERAWVSPGVDQLRALCSGSLIGIDLPAKKVESQPAELPSIRATSWGSAYVPSVNRLYKLYSNGSLVIVDPSSRSRPAVVKLDGPADAAVSTDQSFAVSPDGAFVYVGFRSNSLPRFENADHADRIGIFHAATGARAVLVRLTDPVLTMALSRDGRTLYGVSRQMRSLTVLDVTDPRRPRLVRTIDDVGQAPILAAPGA